MTSTCWASTRGEVMRVTKLSNCCAPQNDACGVVVTDGFISVKLTQEIEAAQVITVKNAADKVCVYDPGCDSLLNLTGVITLCKVNPEAIGIMTGQQVVLDYAGNAVGMRRSTDLACDRRFAVEVWTDVPGTACIGTTLSKQFGYFLVPCFRAATLTGDLTIEGGSAISVELTAKTTIPSLWGTGPQTADNAYKVVAIDVANTPGYLVTPIGATDHDHMQLTPIAPPAIPAACGCTALTVTAGLPQLVSVAPNAGLLAAGGRAVELKGSYFTGTTAVSFGGTAATNFVVVNDTLIEAVYPAKAAGTYPVLVTNPAGVSNAVNVTYV